MKKEDLLERLFHLKNGTVNYLYIMKKTSKSSIKKYQTGGVKPYAGGVKPYAGGVTLAGSNKTVQKPNTGQYAPSTVNTSNNRPIQNASKVTIKPTTSKPTTSKSTTSKSSSSQKATYIYVPNPRTTPPPKFANKQVTKTKDGKTIVTYDTRTRSTLGTYPATVRKVYDNKGNLISGTKTTKGRYGSSTTEKIKDPVKKKTTTKPTITKAITTKPVTKPVTKPATEAKTTPKQVTKPAVTKPAAKTVSQMWVEKTGTPWSEAKKQGFSDGTAASNIALMKKLQSGRPSEYTRAYTGPDYSGDAAAEAAYGEAKTTMRKGGRVNSKMKSKKK